MSEEVRKSSLTFENIDYHLAAVYLGSTMTADRQMREGIRHLVPERKVRTKKGRKPTVHSKELSGPRERKVREEEGEKNTYWKEDRQGCTSRWW